MTYFHPVKKPDFVAKVLQMWVTTAIPTTAANIQIFTKASRRELRRYLDEMVDEGTVELDSDSDGELLWVVPGAQRPKGPTSFAQQKKGAEAIDELIAGQGDALMKYAKRDLKKAKSDDEKSVLGSAAVSLLGPVGWMYAGSWREALPAAGIQLVAMKILPSFLFWPLAAPVALFSGAIGGYYAWRYNRTGKRQRLLPEKSKKDN